MYLGVLGSQKMDNSVSRTSEFWSKPLTSPWEGVDPFLFCSHLVENYPAGDGGLGVDPKVAELTDRDSEWKMYHGNHVPGFPAHPHRGFETITIVPRGLVDHADSLGASARYGEGDVQWLTTGKGVEHGEMFPLLHTDRGNTLELFQIWLNLPPEGKKAPPEFRMFWADTIPVYRGEESDQGTGASRQGEVEIVAGDFLHGKSGGVVKALNPPKNSWAADPRNDVAVWVVTLPAGAQVTLPATLTPATERTLYFYEGDKLKVSSEEVHGVSLIRMLNKDAIVLDNSGTKEVKVLVLQGVPIGQPVVARGPFVLNTESELLETYRDFQAHGYGKWPWPSREQTYGDSPRFAQYPDGRREEPTVRAV